MAAKLQLISEYRLSGAAFWTEEYSNAEINSSIAEELQKGLEVSVRTVPMSFR